MIKRKDLIIIDVESSGLHEDSYPIEVGVYGLDFSYNTLIKPIEKWRYWDIQAQHIHNIKKSEIFNKGKDISLVVSELNEILYNKVVYSDASSWDSFWIDKMFEAANVYKSFEIKSVYGLGNKPFQKDKFIVTRRRMFNEAKKCGDLQHRVEVDTKVIYQAVIETYFK